MCLCWAFVHSCSVFVLICDFGVILHNHYSFQVWPFLSRLVSLCVYSDSDYCHILSTLKVCSHAGCHRPLSLLWDSRTAGRCHVSTDEKVSFQLCLPESLFCIRLWFQTSNRIWWWWNAICVTFQNCHLDWDQKSLWLWNWEKMKPHNVLFFQSLGTWPQWCARWRWSMYVVLSTGHSHLPRCAFAVSARSPRISLHLATNHFKSWGERSLDLPCLMHVYVSCFTNVLYAAFLPY